MSLSPSLPPSRSPTHTHTHTHTTQAERQKDDKEAQTLKREAGSSVSRSLQAIEDCADKQQQQ